MKNMKNMKKSYKVKIDSDGNKRWYLNGKLHNEYGPAIEYASGWNVWYVNGKRSRKDGPVMEYVGGKK